MGNIYCIVTLLIGMLGVLRTADATPSCPTQMAGNAVKIDGQEDLNQAVINLTVPQSSQSNCVTITISNRENYTINLVELLKIKSNFVIIGQSLSQVRLNCAGISNDTNSPLSGLQYVGFHRLAFYDCNIPLWMENITTVDMEEVTFR